MSQQSIGEKLRELRERQGLTREQLYARTKILVNYIEAIEDGRWDMLPGQAYLKPFIKSIAEALNADVEEFYNIIEHQVETKTQPAEEPKSKGFDYRWLVVLLLAAVVAVIVFVLKPFESSGEVQQEPVTPVAVAKQENNHAVLEREYSSNLDIGDNMLEGKKLYRLELTATDTVWVFLMAANDTLYSGLMTTGRRLSRESLSPFELVVGKPNCLNIKYNGVILDTTDELLNKRRIDFAKIEPQQNKNDGDSGEGL